MTTGKILGEKYLENGIVADVSGFIPDMSADIYYEVVRLIDGKFLFLQDHLDRLEQSLSGSGLPYPGSGAIRAYLRLLQSVNDHTLGNIRICIQPGPGEEAQILCYYIAYFYPEICMYKSGVQLVSYPHVRPNPGIKKWDDNFRKSVRDYLRDFGVYEVILMNSEKQITEGSRSNIFFIDKENHLITPPTKDILAGITRKYVLEICREERIEVLERPVKVSELDNMVSCFISGTSPKVLPIWQLDSFQFAADHPLIEILMDRFETIISKNLVDLTLKDNS